MKKIKIARISGEFYNKSEDSVSDYLSPRMDSDTWMEFDEAKKIFDSIKFKDIVKADSEEIFEEYRMTQEQKEFWVLENNYRGFKPYIYLFTFEIPEYIWRKKEIFAKQSGLEDDVMEYITLYTDYSWDLEIEKKVKIPKKISKTFDNFMWIQQNKAELQLKYMQFLVETGGEEDMTIEKFENFMANEGREIIEL